VKAYSSPDGVHWRVDVQLTGSSTAAVVFRHPDVDSSRQDRYAWFIGRGPEARSVTARLDRDRVLEELTDDEIARLFRRSMRVSRPDPLVPAGLPSR
jgi:hypothetical protein